eukprot:scaffold9730_cov63-Phaeocystis_antarctica.AAC.7
MVKKRRWVDSATLVVVCPHTRGSGWAPNWPLPLGAQGHPEPQPGAPRGGGGEDPTKGTLRPCCGTLPSGGRVSAVGSPERVTPCAARSTRKARRAAGPATRASAPPVGPGEALASAVPTRVALLTRVAMPTLVSDVLGGEAQPVARAGYLAVPRTWEALPSPRARPPLHPVGGWRPDGRLSLPAAREVLLPPCRPSPSAVLASRRQRRRRRHRRHRQVGGWPGGGGGAAPGGGGGGSGSGGGGAVVGSSPVPAAFTPAVGLGLRHASMPWRGVDGLEACNRICIRAGDYMRMCMAQQHRCVHTCTVPYLERHASVRDVTGVVEGV